MCRDKEHGGRRCPQDAQKVQERNRVRRERYANQKITETFESLDEEWKGAVAIQMETEDIERAYRIAAVKHAGVKRKSGDVYLDHPLRVARYLQERGMGSDVVSAALLHDVVEDSDMTTEDLSRHGFSDRIVRGVESVTHREGEDYEDAVRRASHDPVGCLVKLADNTDNSSASQLEFLTVKKRLKAQLKYTEARQILWRVVFG